MPLKLDLTGSADACPPKITMYILILAMCWFQQTMSTKHSTFITTPSIIHDQDFVFKKRVFANNAIFSKIMSQSKYFFWLFQAPNISKHISWNEGATIKASWKTAHEFFYFGAKRPFFLKKWRHHPQNIIVLNMYIGTNVLVCERWLVLKVWYTATRPPNRPNAFAIP